MRAFQFALVATAVLALAVGPDARAQVSLDASFVGDGRETISFDLNAAATDRALRVFPTVGGRYLLAGQASTQSNQFALALTRLFPGGNTGGGAQGVDPSFGVDGKLTIALGLSPVIDIAQDSQGRLIVGFHGPAGGGVDVFLTRLLADGSIDGSFGVGGFASLGIELIDDLLGLASGPQDEVLALVRSRAAAGIPWNARVAALDANGLNPKSTLIDVTPERGTGAIAWSPGRDALLVGYVSGGTPSCVVALSDVRLAGAGATLTLSSNSLIGVSLVGLGGTCASVAVTSVAAIPGSEGALVGGHREDPANPGSLNQHGLMFRWEGPDDANISTVAPIAPATDLFIEAVAVDTRGRILSAGTSRDGVAQTRRFSLRRYLQNLGDDTGFNAGSPEITTSFIASNQQDSPTASAADLRVIGTRILVAGASRFQGATDDDFALAAFTTPDAAMVFEDGFEE